MSMHAYALMLTRSLSLRQSDAREIKLAAVMIQNMFPAIDVDTVKLSQCRRVFLFNRYICYMTCRRILKHLLPVHDPVATCSRRFSLAKILRNAFGCAYRRDSESGEFDIRHYVVNVKSAGRPHAVCVCTADPTFGNITQIVVSCRANQGCAQDLAQATVAQPVKVQRHQ